MTWLMFVLFILASVGASHIVVESELFMGAKNWMSSMATSLSAKESKISKILGMLLAKLNYMTNCYQCSGFWAGFLVMMISLFLICHTDMSVLGKIGMSVIGGFIGSVSSVVCFYLIFKLEKWASK